MDSGVSASQKLPGLTQRGTRHFLLNEHVAGRVLVLRQIAESLIDPGSNGRVVICDLRKLVTLPRMRSSRMYLLECIDPP